jgi:hypothetical protein
MLFILRSGVGLVGAFIFPHTKSSPMNSRFFFSVCMTLLASSSMLADESLSPEKVNFFESKIRPVLVRECYGCHSNQAGNVRGGLRLDSKELMLIGGATGPAVVPGNLEESWLYNAITHQDYVMPPKRKLPQSIIDDFKAWIEMGAPDPRVSTVTEIRTTITDNDIEKAKSGFWAYQKPVRAPASVRTNMDWCQTAIDTYILAKLEDNQMQPAQDAEPHAVIRRLYFDLVGLPPTREQADSFQSQWIKDPEAAVHHVVDSLLDTNQFGERWGRHWLDVVRYAESTGREVNITYPHAWRYRDYVIDSFNDDKPFDRFVQEQIAGDLLPVRTDEEWATNLVATTFLAVGSKNLNEQNRIQFLADLIDEQIDTTTRVFLGASVACARCHDHKFDAIPQEDYYALAGIFLNTKTYFGNAQSEYGTFSSAQAKQTSNLIRLPIDDPNAFDRHLSETELQGIRDNIESKLDSLSSLRRGGMQGDAGAAQRQRLATIRELGQLSGRLGNVDENGNPRSFTMGVQENGAPKDARILVRGEIDQPAQTVSRGIPRVLCEEALSIPENTSGRLEFAHWVGSDANPLTARVMVNRIWKHLIGNGIVTSTENFGVTGQPPSHPALLDYLALRFVDSGWSVKEIIREITNSRIYRTSSTFNDNYHAKDPDNALVWRANPRRLEAEVLRDSMLAISGELDLKRPRASEVAKAGYKRIIGGSLEDPRTMGRRAFEAAQRSRGSEARGPGEQSQSGNRPMGRPEFRRPQGDMGFRRPQGDMGFRRPQGDMGFRRPQRRDVDPEMMQAIVRKVTHQLDMEDAKYRSIYLPLVRDEEPRSMAVFDFADSSTITGVRESSHTADQALYMLNNPFVIQQSAVMADHVQQLTSNQEDQITEAFNRVYSRNPTSTEHSASMAFLAAWQQKDSDKSALQALCQSLFASAEFRFVD